MFERLEPLPGDPILSLMAAFRQDSAATKVDLSAGIYRDATGQTPIMAAVAEAEQKVLAEQQTKAYVGLAGNALFNETMQPLIFGAEHPATPRLRTLQTPGGSGALRVAAEFLQQIRPDATLWLSDPSWPNHQPLIADVGIRVASYPYLDRATGTVLFEAMCETLTSQARAGDILLLHGSCHNPSGADLSIEQWQTIATLCVERNLLPFIDTAYLGFGQGLDADAAGLRHVVGTVPEAIVAGSCSKNFGLYKERVGSLTVLTDTETAADATLSHLLITVRKIYSMPPDHGAAIVGTILADPALRRLWEDELAECRERMLTLRRGFATELARALPDEDFSFLAHQSGMFSMLPLSRSEIDALRERYHIYAVGSGRINIPGLPDERLDDVADAIASVRGT
ncbi:MAG: amino acid aminotransferase [Pseudomonadota bacterium]